MKLNQIIMRPEVVNQRDVELPYFCKFRSEYFAIYKEDCIIQLVYTKDAYSSIAICNSMGIWKERIEQAVEISETEFINIRNSIVWLSRFQEQMPSDLLNPPATSEEKTTE